MWLFLWDSEPSKIFVWDTSISKVFLWDTQVRPSGWQPWANTLLYLPLSADTTTTNYWNLNYVFSQTGWTFVNNYYEATDSSCFIATTGNTYTSYTSYTMMCWVKYISDWLVALNNRWDWDNGNIAFYSWTCERWNSQFWRITYPTASIIDAQWHHIALTWQVWVLYFDGLQCGISNNNVPAKPRMVWFNTYRSTAVWWGNSCYSDYILEDKVRTAQEISDYYNLTRWNYWL